MKDNLVINGNIYIMNCPIKQVGAGLFWRIPETAELNNLLKNHHIVNTTIKSKYYTGRVSVYRTESDPDKITISLDDCDEEKLIRKRKMHLLLVYLVDIWMVFLVCYYLLMACGAIK